MGLWSGGRGPVTFVHVTLPQGLFGSTFLGLLGFYQRPIPCGVRLCHRGRHPKPGPLSTGPSSPQSLDLPGFLPTPALTANSELPDRQCDDYCRTRPPMIPSHHRTWTIQDSCCSTQYRSTLARIVQSPSINSSYQTHSCICVRLASSSPEGTHS